MSEPDAVPLPREGEVFFDVRGESRTMRLSWYADSSVAVFSIWQGNRCTGTFRLPFADLVRMVETLQAGPPSRSVDQTPGRQGEQAYANARSETGYGYPEQGGYGQPPLMAMRLVTAQARITKPDQVTATVPITDTRSLTTVGQVRASNPAAASTTATTNARRPAADTARRTAMASRTTNAAMRGATLPISPASLSASRQPLFTCIQRPPAGTLATSAPAPTPSRLGTTSPPMPGPPATAIRLAAPSLPVTRALPVDAGTTIPTTTQVIATVRPSSSRHLQQSAAPYREEAQNAAWHQDRHEPPPEPSLSGRRGRRAKTEQATTDWGQPTASNRAR